MSMNTVVDVTDVEEIATVFPRDNTGTATDVGILPAINHLIDFVAKIVDLNTWHLCKFLDVKYIIGENIDFIVVRAN